MATPASIGRHPIHPMLIVLPLGLWTFSFVCQVIARISIEPIWLTVALYTAGGGVIGALLAAVPGFIDLFSLTAPGIKGTAIWHMSLNLIAVIVWAVVFGLLWSDKPTANLALICSLVGMIIIGVSGWLGGELVYRYGVGVDKSGAPAENLQG